MNVLDWVLIGLAVLYAISGYWQGFITGAAATVGLLGGGVLGIWLAPVVLGNAAPSLWVSLGALFIVILCASLGQAMLQFFGARLREGIRWQPVRALDAVGGAALSSAAVLVVAWALGVAVSGAHFGKLTPLVRGSTVLSKVDAVIPQEADRALSAFNNVVGTTFFPRYLEPFAPERIVPVPPGPARLVNDPDVTRAQSSILKVHSINKCGHGVEGSGFIYAPNRLITNAHVVAGVSDPEVITGDGNLRATVVHYDPALDVAVLAFNSGSRPPLPLDQSVPEKEGVAIVGYPGDGPFTVAPGRIRAQQHLRSPDIYGRGTVIREVYSLRGAVRPGNSGGPILTSEGRVAGLVFAASVTDNDTGYALTAAQIAQAAAEGITQSTQVATGDCA